MGEFTCSVRELLTWPIYDDSDTREIQVDVTCFIHNVTKMPGVWVVDARSDDLLDWQILCESYGALTQLAVWSDRSQNVKLANDVIEALRGMVRASCQPSARPDLS